MVAGEFRLVHRVTFGSELRLELASHRAAEAKPSSRSREAPLKNDVADLDHALQSDELSFVHLIPTEHFGVIAEITQERAASIPASLTRALE